MLVSPLTPADTVFRVPAGSTPDYDNYIAARTATWKAAKTSGNAPAG